MIQFQEVNAYCEDAKLLIGELNEVLIGIIGNNGAQHVNMDDFGGEHAAFFIGYENGEPMCCAGIRAFNTDIGEIKRVYVRKNTRGIAKKLMQHLETWALAHGYQKLILECRELNQHAIHFYEKNGYVVCDKYPPYEDQKTAVCMDKLLVG